LRAIDSRLRIYETESLRNQMDRALWQTRWEASLLGAFGTLAVLIASVGLYGVIAFAVSQRTREFGVRIALGAERHDVVELVMVKALTVTLVGAGFGLLISLASTHLLRGFLYGLSPVDPTTYVSVVLLWMVIALIASCIPAYRAAKVDPAVSLREE
jgi:ABC-type antimicrobial peptide transport system permease subunit